MIVVTGAAGMIGQAVVRELIHEHGLNPNQIMCVDSYDEHHRVPHALSGFTVVDREKLLPWLKRDAALTERSPVDAVIHLGAESSTTAPMIDLVRKNILFTDELWSICTERNIPLLYASSAATYGDSPRTFVEFQPLEQLNPLSPYAISKHLVDMRCVALAGQHYQPPRWYCVKPFNCYGPGEEHKGNQRSIIAITFERLITGKLAILFENSDVYERDFIHVSDAARAICWLMLSSASSGIYNIGTGEARSFLDVVAATQFEMGKRDSPIGYTPMPHSMSKTYQRFTRADIRLLRSVGFTGRFRPVIPDGVRDYVASLYARERARESAVG